MSPAVTLVVGGRREVKTWVAAWSSVRFHRLTINQKVVVTVAVGLASVLSPQYVNSFHKRQTGGRKVPLQCKTDT